MSLPIGVNIFSAENIRNCEEYVFSMQNRLDKAVADNDKKGIRETFDLITKRSDAVKILATWRITQRNQGKYTAGIDGICIPQNESREYQYHIRHLILDKINIDKKPDSIRRVYIPKPNGKKRPLGIPTIHDRIVQEILRIGLDPIVEYHFNGNSYGFRPKRSCQDAMQHLFFKLSRKNCYRYVIEGDIKGCFDNINHEHISETLLKWQTPKWAIENITNILKSKIFHNGQVYNSDTGTPQGGVISPLLANVALTTLDDLCENLGSKWTNPIVRYADDFIITCKNENEGKEIKEIIAEHLQEKVGLTLSEEKSKITHISKGFDFLGFNFRKYKDKDIEKLLIKPQKEKVLNILRNCKEILDNHKTTKQNVVINLINPKIIGWAMYYRHVSSKKVFTKVDKAIWQKLLRWAKRRHNNKSTKWVLDRYFHTNNGTKHQFMDKDWNNKIPSIARIPIKRFIKVNNDHRAYNDDPITLEYWEKREYLNAYNQIESVKRSRLFSKQKSKCPHCKGIISQQNIQDSETHVHHVIPKSKGGTDSYSNLRLIHSECHREIHAKQREQ